jgi:mycothiol S-conjugate amidase
VLSVSDQLCVMTVHAHPDDESSKGAPTIAKYHAEGVKTVLVCCTGGEEGDILNPALDRDDVRADLPAIRARELAEATAIIGYDHVQMLGYRDSGMAGSPSNQHSDSFARADATEVLEKLVRLIRHHRPQVVVGYDDEEFYPHPDHLRVHDVTLEAVDAASDAAAYADAGEPWQVAKVYYTVWSLQKLKTLHEGLLAIGADSPFPEEFFSSADADSRITTRVDVTGWFQVRNEALRAHATQIDPNSPIWFGLPEEELRELFGEDDYRLARSIPEIGFEDDETDLFRGLR